VSLNNVLLMMRTFLNVPFIPMITVTMSKGEYKVYFNELVNGKDMGGMAFSVSSMIIS